MLCDSQQYKLATVGLQTGCGGIYDAAGGEKETVTAIHEFGHAFGVEDHYEPVSENSNFSDDCLYGRNRNFIETVAGISICQGCQDIIRANINRYSN